MADIIELIAQQGKGGQTYPLRMAQMAQAERTRQATDTDRQQEEDAAQLRKMEIEQTTKQFGKQQELDDISRSSNSTQEWMEKLKTGGYQKEYLQAQEMANKISKQTQDIDENKRDAAQEEAEFLAHVLKDAKNIGEQRTAMEVFDKRYPESDVDEMVDRNVYSPERIAMYRYSALAAGDSLKLRREQRLQETADERAALAQEKLTLSKERIALTKEAAGAKSYRAQKKSQTDLRKEYTKETDEVSGALDQITLARTAVEKGSPLTNKMAQATLSKVANSKVRALAELEQYKNFGNLQQRIAGFFSKTLLGTYSTEQKEMALEALDEIEGMYNEMKDDSKDYFRYLANKDKLDSHAVAKYDSPDEIWGNKYLSDEEKIKLAKEVFPNQFE